MLAAAPVKCCSSPFEYNNNLTTVQRYLTVKLTWRFCLTHEVSQQKATSWRADANWRLTDQHNRPAVVSLKRANQVEASIAQAPFLWCLHDVLVGRKSENLTSWTLHVLIGLRKIPFLFSKPTTFEVPITFVNIGSVCNLTSQIYWRCYAPCVPFTMEFGGSNDVIHDLTTFYL